jgi:hypothetical protein
MKVPNFPLSIRSNFKPIEAIWLMKVLYEDMIWDNFTSLFRLVSTTFILSMLFITSSCFKIICTWPKQIDVFSLCLRHDYYRIWFYFTAVFFISQYKLGVSKIKNHYFFSSYFFIKFGILIFYFLFSKIIRTYAEERE